MREQNLDHATEQPCYSQNSLNTCHQKHGELWQKIQDILDTSNSNEKNKNITDILQEYLEIECFRLLRFLSILTPHLEGNIDQNRVEHIFPQADVPFFLKRLSECGLVQYKDDGKRIFISSLPVREALVSNNQDLHEMAVRYYDTGSRLIQRYLFRAELLGHQILAGMNTHGYSDFIELSSCGETGQDYLHRMINTGEILIGTLDPYQRGTVLLITGEYLYLLNRFADSQEYYQKSIEIFTSLHDVPRLADALTSYANVLRFIGKYPEAEQNLKKSLELCKTLDRKTNLPEIAKTHHIFGLLCYLTDKDDESEENLVQAYEYYNQLFSSDEEKYRVPVGKNLYRLINLYSGLNNHERTDYYYQKFLEILDDSSPEKYPDLMNQVYADVTHSYAKYCFCTGKMRDAEELFLKAYQVRKKLVVKNPKLFQPEYANSLFYLAYFYQNDDNPEKATEYHHEAISVHRDMCEQNPLLFTRDYINLQIMAKLHGIAVSAEDDTIAQEDISRFVAGLHAQSDGSPDIPGYKLAQIVCDFGYLYLCTGELSTADGFFSQAMNIIRDEHLQTSETKSVFIECHIKAGHCKFRQDDNKRARKFLSEALSLCREESARKPERFRYETALIHYILGLIEKDSGNLDQALRLCEDSIAQLRLIPVTGECRAQCMLPDVLGSISEIEWQKKHQDIAIEYQIESVCSQRRVICLCEGTPDFKIKLAKKLKQLADLYLGVKKENPALFVLFQGTEIIRESGLKKTEIRKFHTEMLTLIRSMFAGMQDISEISMILEMVLESFRKGYRQDPDLYERIIIDVLNILARHELNAGIHDKTGMYLTELAEILSVIQDKEHLDEYLTISNLSAELSQIEQRRQNYGKAIQYLETGILSQEKILTLQPESWHYRYVTAHMHHLLGDLYDTVHNDEKTFEHYTRVSALFQELPGLPDETLMLYIRILLRTGEILVNKQDFPAARVIYNRNLSVCREGFVRNQEYFRYELAFTLKKFAMLEETDSHPDQAARYSRESIGYLHPIPREREWESLHLLADDFIRLGKLEIRKNNLDEATDYLDQAEVILKNLMDRASDQSRYRFWIAGVMQDLGDIFRERDKITFSRDYYLRGATLLQETDTRDEAGQILRVEILVKIAQIEREYERLDSARNALIQAHIICRNGTRINPEGYRYLILMVLRDLANLELSAHYPEQAEIYYHEAAMYLKDEPENSGNEMITTIRSEICVILENIKEEKKKSG